MAILSPSILAADAMRLGADIQDIKRNGICRFFFYFCIDYSDKWIYNCVGIEKEVLP